MSLVFMDSFDDRPEGRLDDRYHAFDVSSTRVQIVTGRTGSAVQFINSSGSGYLQRNIPSTDHVSVGFWLRTTTAQTANGQGYVRFYEGATEHMSLRINTTSKQLTVTRNATVLATSTHTVVQGFGQHIELRVKIHDTDGEYELKVNGVVVASGTGADTRNGGTGVINAVRITNVSTGANDSGSIFDDYWIDDAGVMHGDCKVAALRPTAAGNATDFTPLSGANWQNVDDTSVDDDTTYNSSDTAGHSDLFTLADLGGASEIRGIQTVTVWRKDDAGTRSAAPLIRTDGATVEGGEVSLADSYTTNLNVWEQNPVTAAPWQPAEIDALEAGYRLKT